MTDDGSAIILDSVSMEFQTRTATGRKRTVLAVDDVSLTVDRGTTLGLVGGTGSGKTTLGHLVTGVLEPTSGRVLVAGAEPRSLRGAALRRHRRRVQVVPQDPYSSLDPRMTVGDIIAEPLTYGLPTVGRRRSAVSKRVEEMLTLVGLPASRAGLYPHQFSGGQRQRIAIARALACGPEIVVLDEPTSALDVSVRAQILNLLARLQRELGVTSVVISHDLVAIAYLSSTIAVMHKGRIVEAGATDDVYRHPQHEYTRLLLDSIPGSEGGGAPA